MPVNESVVRRLALMDRGSVAVLEGWEELEGRQSERH